MAVCSLFALPAQAGSPWDASPAFCQPLVPSVDGALLKYQDGAWEFLSTATGTARLVCAIPNQDTFSFSNSGAGRDVFRMDYRDSDGTGSNVQVTSTLYRRTSGGSVAALGVDFNSNTSSSTSNTSMLTSATDSYTKVDSQTVFMRVDLKRSSTSQTARFSGWAWSSFILN